MRSPAGRISPRGAFWRSGPVLVRAVECAVLVAGVLHRFAREERGAIRRPDGQQLTVQLTYEEPVERGKARDQRLA